MSNLRRRLTGELNPATLVGLPGASDIVRRKLEEFKKEISDKTKASNFRTTGYKSTRLSKSVVEGKIVPKGVALGYKKCVEGLVDTATAETSLSSLVEFVAMMKHRAERDHGGRDPQTQTFYASFWETLNNKKYEGKGEGKNIFPENPMAAVAFDILVNKKLVELRAKYLHENQSKLTKFAVKMRLRTSDKKFEEFMKKVEVDQKNVIEIKKIPTELQDEKSENLYLTEGSNFLLTILVRSVSAFSRTNLASYKEDFLRTLAVIAPGRPTDDDKLKINAFFDYHSTLMTSLTDRKRKLYVEAAANVLVTALCVTGVGEMLITTPILESSALASTPLVTNPLLQGVVQSAVPELLEEVADERHFNERQLVATPIVPVPREKTKSERYNQLVNKEKAAHTVIVGGTVVAGVLTGPIGVGVAGGVGLLLYAAKFYSNYRKFGVIGKTEQIAKQEHEQQFCEFFNKVQKDADYCTSAGLKPAVFADLEKRTMRLSKKTVSTTANILGKMPPASAAAMSAATTSVTAASTSISTTSTTAATPAAPPPTEPTVRPAAATVAKK